MSRVDAWLTRLPGSVAAKSFGISVIVCTALAYPVFSKSNGRQGEDLFSSEKPEVVASGQEKIRRQQRLKRKEESEE